MSKHWNFCMTLTEILFFIISAQIDTKNGGIGFLAVRTLKRASIFVTWNLL